MRPYVIDRLLLPWRLAQARRRRAFVRARDVRETVPANAFTLDFPEGAVAYNSLGRTESGTIVAAVSTKRLAGARLFAFDGSVRLLADLDEILGTRGAIPHGKVHVDFAPFGDALIGATHIGYYDPKATTERPGSAKGFAPYPGGVFFSIDDDRVTPLAQAPAGEGIIAMSVDAARGVAFALTWPGGRFVTLDLTTRSLRDHGVVVQGRICRTIGIDPDGNAYWSDDDGRVYHFNGMSIDVIATVPDLWRKVVWHPERRAFFGVTWTSGTLFRFDPAARSVDAIGSIPAPGTLGFVLDGDTIHALSPGPGILRDDGVSIAATVTHTTIDLATGTIRSSAPLRLADGRWITEAQSLLLDGDRAYTLAWVEVPRTDRSPRAQRIRALRRDTWEFRHRGYAEEIVLARFSTSSRA